MSTSLFRPDLFFGPRPARVLDFLNDRIAVALTIRSMYQVLRIVLMSETFTIPPVMGVEPATSLVAEAPAVELATPVILGGA